MEFLSNSESAMFTYLTDELLLKLGEDGSVNENMTSLAGTFT